MVVLVTTEAGLDSLWFPWRHNEETDEYQVHLSSVTFITSRKSFKGYVGEAEKYVKRYLREALRTFSKAIKLAPTDGYSWSSHFRRAISIRPYQAAGMERCWARIQSSRGVLLADDTGLGKTIQIIGVVSRLKPTPNAPVVIITGSGLRHQWGDEFEKFTPGYSREGPRRVKVIDGTAEERRKALRSAASVYIASYEIARLPQYAQAFAAVAKRARMLVLDESSIVANPENKTFKVIKALFKHTPYVIETNATPIENSLEDTWSQFNLLEPRVLGDHEGFDSRYIRRGYMGKIIGYENLQEYKVRIAHYWFRRTKDDCGVQFPTVVSQTRSVELEGKQLKAYKAIVGEFVKSKATGAVGLAELAKVQRAALTADMDNPKALSAKLDDLEWLLKTELKNERLVVFSGLRTIAEYAARRLASFKPLLYTGKTKQVDKDVARRRFSSKHGVGTVLIGTDAMTKGLNLQAAGVVVNLDLPWNASRLRQRIGRIDRFGQERSHVLVLNYIAKIDGANTVDDYKVSVIKAKRGLSTEIFGSHNTDDLGGAKLDLTAIRGFLKVPIARRNRVRVGAVGESHHSNPNMS